MKFGSRWLILFTIIGFSLIFLVEEVTKGIIFMKIMNSYGEEIVLKSYKVRNSTINIGIIIVIGDTKNQNQYRTARSTVECYSKMYKYNLYIIDMSILTNIGIKCQQKDIFFRRHCFVVEKLKEIKDEWLLFLDADIGVMNPNHLIEEYIPRDDKQIIFYRRIFNHEVMAGSYLFKNSGYSRKFLSFWANYEFQLPNSFHGTDNGALHMVLLKFDALSQNRNTSQIEKCQRLWEKSIDYNTLSIFEVCVQELFLKQPLKQITILPKGRTAWSRDGWLSNSKWSSKDFMFHGWQERRRDIYIHGRWHNPLTVDEIDKEKCDSPVQAVQNWRYKDSFMLEDHDIDTMLLDKINSIQRDYSDIKSENEL
ncbi:unnamed protein product [Auanema sp. JU1783]|nr:unnamed protein product [Auanema sp. JU1783]